MSVSTGSLASPTRISTPLSWRLLTKGFSNELDRIRAMMSYVPYQYMYIELKGGYLTSRPYSKRPLRTWRPVSPVAPTRRTFDFVMLLKVEELRISRYNWYRRTILMENCWFNWVSDGVRCICQHFIDSGDFTKHRDIEFSRRPLRAHPACSAWLTELGFMNKQTPYIAQTCYLSYQRSLVFIVFIKSTIWFWLG